MRPKEGVMRVCRRLTSLHELSFRLRKLLLPPPYPKLRMLLFLDLDHDHLTTTTVMTKYELAMSRLLLRRLPVSRLRRRRSRLWMQM